MVGVSQLNEDIARRFGFMFNADGTAAVAGAAEPLRSLQSPVSRNAARAPSGTPSQQMRSGLQPRAYAPPRTVGEDTAIMRPPRRHVNICKKIMQWVFDW